MLIFATYTFVRKINLDERNKKLFFIFTLIAFIGLNFFTAAYLLLVPDPLTVKLFRSFVYIVAFVGLSVPIGVLIQGIINYIRNK